MAEIKWSLTILLRAEMAEINLYIISWGTEWANKNLNKTFNYTCGSLAVIIRLLFNARDALWLWHRRKRFVIVVYFKMTRQRDNRVKVSALLRKGHKVSEWNLARCIKFEIYNGKLFQSHVSKIICSLT